MAGRAYCLDDGETVPVTRVLGQSYATNAWGPLGAFIGDAESELSLTPFYEGAGFAPFSGPVGPGAGVNIPGHITDISGLSQEADLCIATAFVIAYQRLSRRMGLAVRPRIHWTAAYPGSGWYNQGNANYLAPGSTAWTNDETLQRLLPGLLEPYERRPIYEHALWFQGGEPDYATSLQALHDMTAANDSLGLPTRADGMNFYIGQVGAQAWATTAYPGAQAQLDFCRSNANGRSWLSGPWYQRAYGSAGPGDTGYIHPNGVSTALMGEEAAQAALTVERLNMPWNPLWRSSAPCTISGNTVNIPLQRPPGLDYASGALSIDTTTIEQAPGWGWHLNKGGVLSAAQSVGFSGDVAQITFAVSPASGDSISYASDGPGQSAPYTHAGVWGNVKLPGPPSVLISGKSIDAWLVAFRETLA